jgi:hypothetical protein
MGGKTRLILHDVSGETPAHFDSFTLLLDPEEVSRWLRAYFMGQLVCGKKAQQKAADRRQKQRTGRVKGKG